MMYIALIFFCYEARRRSEQKVRRCNMYGGMFSSFSSSPPENTHVFHNITDQMKNTKHEFPIYDSFIKVGSESTVKELHTVGQIPDIRLWMTCRAMLNVAEKKKTIKSRGINNNCPAKGSREIERNRCFIARDEDGKLQVIERKCRWVSNEKGCKREGAETEGIFDTKGQR